MTLQEQFAIRCVKFASKRLKLKKPVRVVFCNLPRDYLGYAYRKLNRIEFDVEAIAKISDYDICDIALHECCHLKNKIYGHGKSFQKRCIRAGANPSPDSPVWLHEYGWIHMIRED
jgi:predicted metal-dependent hydrolase